MAWTSGDLVIIEAAIASGEESVTFTDGRSVRYRSITELMKARDAIKATVENSSGSTRTRFSYGKTSKA